MTDKNIDFYKCGYEAGRQDMKMKIINFLTSMDESHEKRGILDEDDGNVYDGWGDWPGHQTQGR